MKEGGFFRFLHFDSRWGGVFPIIRFANQICLAFLFATPVFSQGHYPLQIGNVWQYRDSYDLTYGFTTKAIKDTIMPNGLSYVVLFSDQELDTLYFRQSDSAVYNYSTRFQHEQLWYDFSRQIGDTIAVLEQPFDTSDVILISYQLVNFFGKNLSQWQFLEEWRKSSLYDIRTIVDSIGLIDYEYEGGMAFSLSGAIINGTKYGTIARVDQQKLSVPSAFTLSQNYPNPFNPATTILFKVQSDQQYLSLVVYNALGQQIIKLYEGTIQAGSYRIVWNGRDWLGKEVGSGIYFYQLRTNNHSETKKMVLIR